MGFISKKSLVIMAVALAIIGNSCSKKNNNPADEGDANPPPEVENPREESKVGDVVGQITTGYQGWFSCAGDGSPMGLHWWHWTHDWQQVPSMANISIKSWPDNDEYDKAYTTNFAATGNGEPAKLFSSFDDQTVDVHFSWMKDYGIHTAALQRFNPTGDEGPIRNAITEKVKTSAEKYGVKFYIMYDVSGWINGMPAGIKNDWTTKMKKYAQSSQYAMQNGKPVVGIWGFGFNDTNHPWSADVCLDVIKFFKDQGCYVMGGTPTNWRTQTSDSRPQFLKVYKEFDMISPWMVGRIGSNSQSDEYARTINRDDLKYCKDNGIDYQPCVLPGDLQERQRKHGDFMWRQFYNLVRLGVKSIYISMFDEYNEGNQIAKTAETQADVPTGSGIFALDEDGTPCSSDYYLRLTNDGGKMLRKEIPITSTRPTIPKP